MTSISTYYTDHLHTPLGTLRLYATQGSLVGVFFERHQKPLPPHLTKASLQKTSLLEQAKQELTDYFIKKNKIFTVPVQFEGTAFQQNVWQELQTIAWGDLRSYSEHAYRLGQPRSVRAIAAAIGKNPLSILVPCHRIIGQKGQLTGYAGGLENKSWLLAHEGHSMESNLVRRVS